MPVSATLFAAGSLLFSILFVRGRSIPLTLAWLGVGASIIVIGGAPLQGFRMLGGTAAWAMWMPMLVFEIALAIVLLTKGVSPGVRPQPGA